MLHWRGLYHVCVLEIRVEETNRKIYVFIDQKLQPFYKNITS